MNKNCKHESPALRCSQCGTLCDDTYGYGPDEVHCSITCHDAAMRAHARDRMTPEERALYDDIHKIATAKIIITGTKVTMVGISSDC